MKRCAIALALVASLAACDRKPPTETAEQQGAHREVLQGFQATFYRVSEGKQQWIEVAIAVDGSKTFRMPVFFSDNGRLVQVNNNEARALIDKWLKQRAANVASFGSIDPQVGGNTPFLAIDRNSP
jgi:predicted small lipoprotein YifL